MKILKIITALMIIFPFSTIAQEKNTIPNNSQKNGMTDEEFETIIEDMPEEKKQEIIFASGKPVKMFNYRTGETDIVNRLDKIEDEKAIQYLPPLEEASNLYFNLREEEELPPFEALFETMLEIKQIIEKSE